MGLVNETVFQFNSEYNLGKDSAKSLMAYCRPAVEKYIFSKVLSLILINVYSYMIKYLQCML